MNSYYLQLQQPDSTEKDMSITAGSLALTLHFYWDVEMQEQYDTLVTNVRKAYLSEPLYNKATGDIIRTYDYIDYFTSLPDTLVELEELYNASDSIIPYRLLQVEDWQAADALLLMRSLCKELQEQDEQISTYLKWHCTITSGDEIIEALVVPNSTYRAADSSFTITFVSDRDDIVRDMLGDCYIVVEVQE